MKRRKPRPSPSPGGRNNGPHPVIRLRLWLETEDGVMLGLGRLLLLEAIRDEGSLKKAAERLGMSYRAAWGKLKTTEEALAEPLLEKVCGGRGYKLTPFAADLVADFRKLYDEVENKAASSAAMFPFAVHRYGE
ncbi:winged helix-turn-helix domain-containing protein [Oceanidesulfovibrio marinus]|uniref:ModE family transcriptional regulator n=1 Tax=Oceanidesulfovibrio marinus TaxID=370038 RepID=A0A6P1ZGT6_9BACT|nr:LysR family transcriptional regulator [Oceanidesulfovibrio marinus]TVM32251.1 ModE family transcriptional regulator [Oceanidesulfovibrio marinus]